MPRFHIILCTYNPRTEYLREQLASIAAQTHPDWTCHLLDDRSSPESLALTQAAIRDDPRFTLFPGAQRVGVFHNFERGLELTPPGMDLICYCDQDDAWEPDKLAVLALECADPGVSLAHSDLKLVDSSGREVHPSCFAFERRNVEHVDLATLMVRNCVTGCTAAFRADLVPRLLPFPRQGPHPAFHHDLWTALIAAQFGRFAVVRRPLVRYRQHGANVIGAEDQDRRRGLKFRLQAASRPFQAVRAHLTDPWRLRKTIINHLLEHCTWTDGRRGDELRQLRSWAHGYWPGREQRRLLRAMAGRRDPNLGLAARIVLGRALTRLDILPRLRRLAQNALRLSWKAATDPHVRRRVLTGMDHLLTPEAIPAVADKTPINARPEALEPVTCRPMKIVSLSGRPPALNVLVPGITPESVFGGVATAVRLALALVAQGITVRLASSDALVGPQDGERIRSFLAERFQASHDLTRGLEIIDATAHAPITCFSAQDLFLATAWWTAVKIKATLDGHAFRNRRFIYLIQDYEPGFQAWSDDYALSRSTYDLDCIPVLNTSLLARYLEQRTGLHTDPDLILGPEIDWAAFAPAPAEEIRARARPRVFLYARPQVPRNLFRTMIIGLGRFIREHGLSPGQIEVVGAGQPHPPLDLGNSVIARPLGKLSMADYARELRASDLGLSLMLSPHPSYPPLEMAASGLITVTNRFADKNLDYSANLLSCDPVPDSVARALAAAWPRVADAQGRVAAAAARPRLGRDMNTVAAGLARRLRAEWAQTRA